MSVRIVIILYGLLLPLSAIDSDDWRVYNKFYVYKYFFKYIRIYIGIYEGLLFASYSLIKNNETRKKALPSSYISFANHILTSQYQPPFAWLYMLQTWIRVHFKVIIVTILNKRVYVNLKFLLRRVIIDGRYIILSWCIHFLLSCIRFRVPRHHSNTSPAPFFVSFRDSLTIFWP